ncbi:MAG TPA: MoaD/ThiS family protein [Caldilineaceae bacterium]|nr:MoaD/ThiS family protein [Caldilineaceae bacterium]
MEHEVWIPALHRDLTGGVETVKVEGETVGEVVAALEARFPGIAERLTDDGRIRPYISVAINGVITHRGLRQRLTEPSEIHFVPALGGG